MRPPTPRRSGAYLVLLCLTVASALVQAGCDPRPSNPPRPTDPDRSVPRPITAPAVASAASR